MENIFYVAEYPGENDSQRIGACLKEASGCAESTVVFSGRDFLISEAILLYAGMTILVDNCTIRQMDGTFDNVFRGANIHLNPDQPSGAALSIDALKNVRLFGRGQAVIEGCAVNRRGYHPILKQEQDMVGDYWGFLTYQVLFVSTTNLEIGGLSFLKTRCWAVTLDLCTNLHLHDLVFHTEVKNGDGIHLLSGCSHGIIERISGTTSDDTVAVQAGFRLPCLPYKNYLAAFTPTEKIYAQCTPEQLDCHDLQIRDIKAGGQMHNIILLALNDSAIYQVEIE
ncbi:MAG: hypothetical protein RR951_08440, partial [Ruthenibacterium sp.]